MKLAKGVRALANVTLLSLTVVGVYSALKLREACDEIKSSGNEIMRNISRKLDRYDLIRDPVSSD